MGKKKQEPEKKPRMFRIKSTYPSMDGSVFQVDAGASAKDIEKAAMEAALKYMSYTWEEIK